MIKLGLTGSIAMGKTTTAALFAEAGIPIYSADAAVHDLYQNEAVTAVRAAFPEVVLQGVVDRKALSAYLLRHPEKLADLEAIVHPLVREKETKFLREAADSGRDIVLLDIPLLFETGAEARLDKVVVVTCDPEVQKQRILARPDMTSEKMEMILKRQMPDAAKRERADFLVDTGHGIEAARRQVEAILDQLRAEQRENA